MQNLVSACRDDDNLNLYIFLDALLLRTCAERKFRFLWRNNFNMWQNRRNFVVADVLLY